MSNLEEIKKRNENNSPNHLQHIVSIPFLTCNTNAKVREEKSLTLSNGVRSNLPKKKAIVQSCEHCHPPPGTNPIRNARSGGYFGRRGTAASVGLNGIAVLSW